MSDKKVISETVLTTDEINMLADINTHISQEPFYILIVDDNQRMRESLSELLAIYGMNSTLSESGSQALDLLESEHFDLVLLDLEMPRIDGFQVMSKIHEHYPDTDIIILSGKTSFENALKAWRMGAQDFLKKPYVPSELIELIKKIREKRRLNTEKMDKRSSNSSLSNVDKTLMELEDIIHNEDLTLAHEIINSSPAVALLWKNISPWQVHFVSENVVNLLGYTAKELLTGKVIYKDIIHPDDEAQFMEEVKKDSKTTKFKHKPYRIITKCGVVKWVDDSTSLVRDKQGNITYYQEIIIDVTERELSRQKMLQKQISLEHIAHHDVLTGLPNRLLLLDRMQQSIKKAQRTKKHLAVLYIDLDKFKSINDSLGHAAGDEVLMAVAKRLRENVRTVDTIARIGGDEFIVLMESVTNVQDVKTMAEKLNHSLNQPIYWDMRELFITCSIGISLAPDDGDTPKELLKKADVAMYQSKEEGRNTFQFYYA
ncbi:MAG: diguanylate cyclase [Gammaproteobacteria bacterium]|nr:diguanylate cyclase [Gammaproteobacteria bacterium]